MTGLVDDGATKQPRRSKRLERSCPEAAAEAPPARRTRHANGRVPPGERETAAPAARMIARSPPPSRRAEGSVPAARVRRSRSPPCSNLPPKSEGSAATAYVLRNRHVPDTSNREPYLSARQEKREELKHDRPCSSRKKLKQHEPWEPLSCARVGLEHYNSMNQGDEHELVEAVDADPFIWGGGWLHANFLAKPKGDSSCVDLVPEYFFAELKLDAFGLHCASCVKMDSVETKNLGGCARCRGKIKHPVTGGYLGASCQPGGAAAGHLGPSLFELQLYNKQLELLDPKELNRELDGW